VEKRFSLGQSSVSCKAGFKRQSGLRVLPPQPDFSGEENLSYYDVAKGLTGRVPDTPLSLAQETVRDAVTKIYQENDWSFQRTITYANWLCPGQVANAGTFTVTPYSATVVADATATAALATAASAGNPLLTTLQFRNPQYSIYNVIGYNPTGSGAFATLTLDRPWLEPTKGPGQPYMLYQCYYVAPLADFQKFIEVRDTTNAAELDFWSLTQADLAVYDPQRTEFADPSYVVPAGVDQRPGSATLGYPMFELWPQQLSYIPYSFSFRRLGVIPQTYSDFVSTTLPPPLTEELLKWRSQEVLYQYKEAQRDKTAARGSGSNWILLAQMAAKEYERVLDKILAIDLNLNGEAITRIRGRMPISRQPYSNQLGGLNVGGYPDN
jgi:hypothetical protein